MSDTELKTPNKTGASGAAWTDAEKIAYLIVLCETDGKAESKIPSAPIPAGRSIVSCKKLLWRLKEKHKDDIERLKAGMALTAATSGDGEATATPDKTKTPRKRKTKADRDGGDELMASPKKKATPRKKKNEVVVKEEAVEEENAGEDEDAEDNMVA